MEAICAILTVDKHDPNSKKPGKKLSTTDPAFRQILTAGFDSPAKADSVGGDVDLRNKQDDHDAYKVG